MKVGAIVQARMSSSRCPGKVLRKIAGKPLLAYLLERLGHCRRLDDMVVATSDHQSDTLLAEFCHEHRTHCFRGALDNVARRFSDALEVYPFDAFVRVSSDSPLLDPQLIDYAVEQFATQQADVVTNIFPRTYPAGQSVEVIGSEAFKRAFPRMHDPRDIEHVTPYFYRNNGMFRIKNLVAEADWSGIHLAVDSEQDLLHLTRIIEQMDGPHWRYGVAEIVRIHEALTATTAGA